MLRSGGTRPLNSNEGRDETVAAFSAAISSLSAQRPQDLRAALTVANDALAARFRAGDAVEALVGAHADLIDALLLHLWHELGVDDARTALAAVGGYGRGELHPGSDIDVLVLLDDDSPDTTDVGSFVTALWDVGLEVGHSVRTVAQCADEARDDVTVATTLMEARRLAGPQSLFDAMLAATAPAKIWTSQDFFRAKRDEQRARHLRYDDTGYNLEPNVKGSPGGLRDIQMVGWIAKRHFGTGDLSELIRHDFLSRGQYERLIEGRHFLWTVRYGLHVLTGRREDRLLFDHQKSLALMLGYEDARFTLGVEQMMQRYYRTVMEQSRLNEMLLQLFEEDILLTPDEQPEKLDESFVSRNGYLQTVDDDVFARNPSALLSMFRCLQNNPELKGVSARTLGLVRRSLDLIDEQFRQHPRNHRLFLDILRAPHGVTRELRRMNRYGLLGLYIPAFGRIVGRMQYDLFHAYTVDEHTLFVVSNLRRFSLDRFADEFPHCTKVMQQLDDQMLALLAGLFHDIAKGRGGDHSELGAVDALAFCREHGLDEGDATLVSWLVQNHLVLSMTAQKKDITDPEVIGRFAKLVGDKRHLDYLYVLTAADVRGTNPKLWNSWKSKLFRDLYDATCEALSRGLENPLEIESLIRQTQQEALKVLNASADDAAIETIWQQLPDEYFQRHSGQEVAWHTRALQAGGLTEPQLHVQAQQELNGIAIMLYTPHVRHTFAAVTAALDELGLSVLDARIEPIKNGFSLDTYIVVEQSGEAITEERLADVLQRLDYIPRLQDDRVPTVHRKVERRQRMFNTRTGTRFRVDKTGGRTEMELTCSDHPGLLLTVGEVLIECGLYINAAKIVTIGERAEDVFYLTDQQEQPLSETQCEQLGTLLRERIEQRLANNHKSVS